MEKKILVVDDDREFVDAVEALLTANGFETIAAHDGAAGVALAKEEKPDLITMDVMMANDGEGLDAVKQIVADLATADIPVILMTGIKKAEHLTNDYNTGEKTVKVRAVLEKPIKPDELLKAVQAQLAEAVEVDNG